MPCYYIPQYWNTTVSNNNDLSILQIVSYDNLIKSQQHVFPEVLILDMVSSKNLNLDVFFKSVLTIDKFTTVSKWHLGYQEILYNFNKKRHLDKSQQHQCPKAGGPNLGGLIPMGWRRWLSRGTWEVGKHVKWLVGSPCPEVLILDNFKIGILIVESPMFSFHCN